MLLSGGFCWSDPTQPRQGFRGFHRPFRKWYYGLLFLIQWNNPCVNSRDTEAARAKWAVTLLEAHLLLFLTKCPQQIFFFSSC